MSGSTQRPGVLIQQPKQPVQGRIVPLSENTVPAKGGSSSRTGSARSTSWITRSDGFHASIVPPFPRLLFGPEIPVGELFAHMGGHGLPLSGGKLLFIDNQQMPVPTARHDQIRGAFIACVIIAPIPADFS